MLMLVTVCQGKICALFYRRHECDAITFYWLNQTNSFLITKLGTTFDSDHELTANKLSNSKTCFQF